MNIAYLIGKSAGKDGSSPFWSSFGLTSAKDQADFQAGYAAGQREAQLQLMREQLNSIPRTNLLTGFDVSDTARVTSEHNEEPPSKYSIWLDKLSHVYSMSTKINSYSVSIMIKWCKSELSSKYWSCELRLVEPQPTVKESEFLLMFYNDVAKLGNALLRFRRKRFVYRIVICTTLIGIFLLPAFLDFPFLIATFCVVFPIIISAYGFWTWDNERCFLEFGTMNSNREEIQNLTKEFNKLYHQIPKAWAGRSRRRSRKKGK